MNNFNYVVIQAGGVGSRMGSHTKNKPKCMVSYNGKSMIQHTIDYFENKKIIIICDYKKDLLKSYISKVLKYDVIFIDAKEKSTTSGLNEVYNIIPENEPFVYLWSDLILTEPIEFKFDKAINIYLTDDVLCRWSVAKNKMVKESSSKNGVAGLFSFKNKEILKQLNFYKSFVGGNIANFHEEKIGFINVKGLMEIGTEQFYDKLLKESNKSRFFNDVKITNNFVVKKCINPIYDSLIENEINWYNYLKNKVDFIPTIFSLNPLTMNKICGNHIFDLNLSKNDKLEIIKSICDNLIILHSIIVKESNYSDLEETYINKTISRVYSVKDIIPLFETASFFINNKHCINPFYDYNIKDLIIDVKSLLYTDKYTVIHGDPTFSNILVNNENKSFFIDPRGIFGNTKIYGDSNYDWAKLYYSVNGNYDSINSKSFSVKIQENKINLDIKSNGFEKFSSIILKKSNMTEKQMLLHQALIWLSLTGYVKEDYDSILYAFFYGVLLWNLARG